MQGRLHPVSPVSIADCPHSLAHDPLCAERTALPAAPPHQGGAAGCPVYFHFCLQKGLRNRRNGHVSAGGGRAAGGVDKEEICGGSGPVHVAECGPGLAAHSPGRSAGSCVPDPAGGCSSRPRRRHHPRGWSGAGGGGHCQPGVPYRRIHPGTQAPRRRGLCRHRGRGGRMCAGGKASLRPEPL